MSNKFSFCFHFKMIWLDDKTDDSIQKNVILSYLLDLLHYVLVEQQFLLKVHLI